MRSRTAASRLKREWIEPQKAARQIAAHANAARGEPILWLIGVDEKQGVIGAAPAEFSAWFNALAACFEGLPPSCADLNVPRDGRAITALLFDTARAPFVVKNPRHGKMQGDVIAFEDPARLQRDPPRPPAHRRRAFVISSRLTPWPSDPMTLHMLARNRAPL
jgi:hypothetical protein